MAVGCTASYFVKIIWYVPVGFDPPPLFWGWILLILRSPKGGCCSISDDLSCSSKEYSFLPRAVQIELEFCDPTLGIWISPFTYAYYLICLCYNGLGQYDNRDRALRQLVDNINDKKRCCLPRSTSYNIAGNCMLMAGYIDSARDTFEKSAKGSHRQRCAAYDKYNAAYKYLSCMWSNW